ncbi:ATP synthase F0 subunit 8 (mitochondrion) [Diaphorina citri]|uniref:ATP synthase F0 subunit 8 n=1 Tax=Diaphorina citri TaxID=121845 RepID=A0A343W1H3_DIACI|nr:ATP synthase F0 subunit 8 [Diaphorina citri]ANC65503.1 ATP synthase F0 subunit 8 [Diaphorina citri]AOW71067.1 ATP synthase F0 subunit 8 [Diaphorina citri]ATD85654.1 ATP synthase F0 subunit 8 [Diaphorina citri]ATD85667.1 ATP synthase F0 subunit 8 [Diaphorina citri]ATD85680.1 ATP synthase F0 subunit 8 [Diaphorina citri]
MPQMSPLPWLTILIFSIFMLTVISSIIYFTPKYYLNSKKETTKPFMNIKW